MKRLLELAACASLLALATTAHAEGINLSWDDCGSHGVSSKTFACDSNAGSAFVLFGSFVPPAGTTAITGEEIVLDIGSVSAVLPSWWSFQYPGMCRQYGAAANTYFPVGPFSCADYWTGQAQGGIASYIMNYSGLACRARMRLVFAVPGSSAGPLDPELEYYAFRLSISRAKSVGAGACEGCADPVTLWLLEIKITQPVGLGDYRLWGSLEGSLTTWQGKNPYASCLFVPARNTTWGAIKAQYR